MRAALFVILSSLLTFGQVQVQGGGFTVTSGASISSGSNSTVTLTSVTIAPTSTSIAISGTATFTATAHFSNSTTQDVTLLATWSSSNTSVATVGASANPQPFAGVSAGTTNISAIYLGVTSSVAVLTVTPVGLSITTTSCPLGTVSVAYTCQLTATGGTPPYTWSISSGSLPSWASLNSSTGLISGTPNLAAVTNFTVQVADSGSHTATQALSITVVASGGVTDENFYDNVDGTCKNLGTQDGPANLPSKCFNTALANTPSPGGFYCVYPTTQQVVPATCTGAISHYSTLTGAFSFISSSCSPASATCIPCGSTIKVVATTDGTPSGAQNIYDEFKLTYPEVACNSSNWITVETDMIASLPPEQTRISPAWTNIASLPSRPSYNQPSVLGTYMPMIRSSAYATAILTIAVVPTTTSPVTSFARFIGLELSQPGPTSTVCGGKNCVTGWNNAIVQTSCDPTGGAICSDHIILDRVILDDDAHTGLTTESVCFGVLGSGTNWAIIDSYIYDIKSRIGNLQGNCESHGIAFGNVASVNASQGPYKIVNNYIEASGENFFTGGGYSVSSPMNVQVRRNHMFKPFNLWMPFKPGYLGTPMLVKNIYETKDISQVLIEGNIFEYIWYGPSNVSPFTVTDQFAAPILLHAAAGSLNAPHQSPGQDVTFRYNWVRHSGRSLDMDIAGCDSSRAKGCGPAFPPGDVAPIIQRESVHDNFVDDVSGRWYTKPYSGGGSGFDGASFIFSNSLENVGIYGTLNNVKVNHNTIITSSYSQDLVVSSIVTNGTGTATLTYTNTPPIVVAAGRRIQVFGSCTNFNEYATVGSIISSTQFTYVSSAPASTTCNSGFVSMLDATTVGAMHINEAASDSRIVGVTETGSLAGVIVNTTSPRSAAAVYQFMCFGAGSPDPPCKNQTIFTVWGLTGANICYNSNQAGCGAGGTTTTPATWALVGRAFCSATGIGTVTINAGGTGYSVNDVVTVVQSPGADGSPAGQGTLTVTSVSGGVVTGLSITTPGNNYLVANGLAVTGGHGTGLTVNITAITAVGAGGIVGSGSTTPCSASTVGDRVFWFNHIQSGLPAATVTNAFFSYWASLGRNNYGPTNPNPGWQGITVTNNIISGKILFTQGNCALGGSTLTSDKALNTCGGVATTGPGAVNFTCNVLASHAMIATSSTTDTLPTGNVDTSDHTFASVGFNNFNFDNLGLAINNLNDIALSSSSPYFTGVSTPGCTSDGQPTGANMTQIQTYTAGVN